MEQPRSTPQPIESIYVVPPNNSLQSPGEAIACIESSSEPEQSWPLIPYEVGVRYSNGDEVRGQFKDKATAVAFLRNMR